MPARAQAVRPAAARPERTIGDVEILRGVAIAMVLLEHLPLNLLWWHSRLFDFLYYTWHGAMGVDLFFVISGFVIARGLLPQLEAAHGPRQTASVLWRFWLRRIFRLLPAAWLWLGVSLWIGRHVGDLSTFGDTHQNWRITRAALLNVANLYFAWLESGGNTAFVPFWSPSIVYWSLSLEEQFYVVLPLAALLFERRLVWLLLAAVAAQFLLPYSPYTDLLRPGALAVGVLLAMAAATPWFVLLEAGLPRSRSGRWFGLLAAIIALGRLGIDSTSWKLGAVALVSGLLVFAASFDQGYVWPGQASGRVMRWLGSRSYALYLTHMPSFRLIHQFAIYRYGLNPPRSPWRDAVAIMLALSLAVLAAEATHRLVERPCKALGRWLTTRHFTARRA